MNVKRCQSYYIDQVIEMQAKFQRALFLIGVDKLGESLSLLKEISRYYDAVARIDGMTDADVNEILEDCSPRIVNGLIRLIAGSAMGTGRELSKQGELF